MGDKKHAKSAGRKTGSVRGKPKRILPVEELQQIDELSGRFLAAADEQQQSLTQALGAADVGVKGDTIGGGPLPPPVVVRRNRMPAITDGGHDIPEAIPDTLTGDLPNPFRSKQVKALLKKITGQSASRSDVLAAYLLFRGLGAEDIYQIVKAASQASVSFHSGGKVISEPDYRVRMWAAEFLAKTLGYIYAPRQDKAEVPAMFVQIVNEVRQTPTGDLIRQAKTYGIEVDPVRFHINE